MAFDSLQAFWQMDGHGPYVWTCYAVFFLTMIGMTGWSLLRRRDVVTRVRRQQQLSNRSRNA